MVKIEQIKTLQKIILKLDKENISLKKEIKVCNQELTDLNRYFKIIVKLYLDRIEKDIKKLKGEKGKNE